MKRYQKQLSFILILAILLTVFTAAPFKVSAASNYLVIYQPEDEQGERIGTIQTENYGDWSEREFNGGTRIMLSVHAEDGYEFVGWDVRVQNGAAKEVKNSPVTVKKGEDTNEENGWVWSPREIRISATVWSRSSIPTAPTTRIATE